MSEPVLLPVRRMFRAFAQTFVPEFRDLDESAWVEVEALADRVAEQTRSDARDLLGAAGGAAA